LPLDVTHGVNRFLAVQEVCYQRLSRLDDWESVFADPRALPEGGPPLRGAVSGSGKRMNPVEKRRHSADRR
jgi:hypothetical protein